VQRRPVLTSSYTLICTSTDYDAWRVGEAPVTVEEVVKTLHTNAAYSRAVAAGILQAVHDHVAAGKLTGTKGSMQWSCLTKREVRLFALFGLLIGYRGCFAGRRRGKKRRSRRRRRMRVRALVLMDRLNRKSRVASSPTSCLTTRAKQCGSAGGSDLDQ
jgi:hypothetical protein